MIIVCGLNAVQDMVDKHAVGRVVSLLSPDTPHRAFKNIVAEQHLRLTFHDVVEMLDGLAAPRATDAEKLIEFIEDWDRANPMLIHCWAGISRSTASAYTALCMLRPKADEEELAFELRAASPSATPNRLIVSYADALLGRNGRMSRAIEKIGRGEDAFEGTPFILRP
jgi:predicted protein tyrosine phosphatase